MGLNYQRGFCRLAEGGALQLRLLVELSRCARGSLYQVRVGGSESGWGSVVLKVRPVGLPL